MLRTIVLDNTELSKIIFPKHKNHEECLKWLMGLLERDNEIAILEVVDYESRRGLLHKNMKEGIERLDHICESMTFVPITTDAMKNAAEFWAEARKKGKQAADEKSLDADAIIAAQTFLLSQERRWEVVIATGNARHFSAFSKIKAALPSAIS